MTVDLRPYPDYQDSGVEWLGQIPAHWDYLPHRALFQEIKDQGHVDEPLLSVTISKGIIRQSDFLAGSSKKDSSNLDKSKYKLVVPGDIAYNKMRAWQGAVGVSHHRGIVSPAYIVVRLRNSNNPEYFHFLFRTAGFATEAERWSYGITSDQWSLRHEHFKMIYSCVPLQPEQDAIVAFLRHADARVRRFIRNRRRLIEVLNEQKQAIINRAVTQGLDPHVPLKPSGVPWLGDIPQHWQVVTLQRVTQARCDGPFGSGLKSDHYVQSGIRVIRLQNIGWAEFNDQDKAFISKEYYDTLGNHDVLASDLLIASLGDEKIPPGRACVAPPWIMPAMVKADCFRFRLDQSKVISSFAALQMSATAGHAAAALSAGATRQRINLQRMSSRLLILPPRSEQDAIVRYAEKATSRLRRSVDTASSEIDLIREYRTRLIADVVTGKVDVRHLAPPPEALAAEAEPEDLDEGLDDETIGEDDLELVEEVSDAGD
jgi:type I restriction enzyme, S subunit